MWQWHTEKIGGEICVNANLLIALRGGAVMPPLRRKMGSLVYVIREES